MTALVALFAVIILVALRSIREATALTVSLDLDPNKESNIDISTTLPSSLVGVTLPPQPLNTTRIYDTVTNRDTKDSYGFMFTWLTAGPGGFASGVAPGNTTGKVASWVWDSTGTASNAGCFTSGSPLCPLFTPADLSTPNRGPFAFSPGRAVSASATVTTASLLSSLLTLASPPRELVRVTSDVLPLANGEFRYQTRVRNLSSQVITFDLASGPLACGTCQEPLVACGGLCCDTAHCDSERNVCRMCATVPGVSQDCNGDGICEDLQNDNQNCGACGAVCAGTCTAGVCFTCPNPETQTNCDGVCVDTSSDRNNCGACGVTCSPTESCTGGKCTSLCGNGVIDPGEQCDGQALPGQKCSDFDFCSGSLSCDTTCQLSFANCVPCIGCATIPGELEDCTGTGICVNLLSSPLNCGQCGNACPSGDICSNGQCICGPFSQDCDGDGVCDSLQTDTNCGSCGNTCPQGTSCLGSICGNITVLPPGCGPLGCVTAALPSVQSLLASPRATAPPPIFLPIAPCEFPVNESDTNPNDVILQIARPAAFAVGLTGSVPAGQEVVVDCQVNQHPGKEVTSQLTVCGGDDIPDGPVTCSGGGAGSQGTSNVFVPDTTVNIGGQPFLAVLRAEARDSSGDGVIEPGETVRLFVTLSNVGPKPFTGMSAILSAPDVDLDGDLAPDGGDAGPDPVSITQNASAYPDIPGAPITPGVQTCSNSQPLTPGTSTNTTPFTIVFPADHPSDTSHPFHLNVTGQTPGGSGPVTLTFGVNFDLSVAGACVPGAARGAFDSLQGLLSPMGDLVPEGNTLPAPRTFNQGSTLPLKLRLACGGSALNSRNSSAPLLVGLKRNGTPIDLSTIDVNAGASNGGGLLFRSDDGKGQWTYNLSTSALQTGTYLLTIRMPNGQRYVGTFVLR